VLQVVTRDPVGICRACEGFDTHQRGDRDYDGSVEDLQIGGVGEDLADIGWA
jgi:hypothetical protein